MTDDERGPRGWVFTDDATNEEVGFAEPGEYYDADEAVQGFGQEYAPSFSVYFRDHAGRLNSCADESTVDDFTCRYCGQDCPIEAGGSLSICDGFAGDVDGLYQEEEAVDEGFQD